MRCQLNMPVVLAGGRMSDGKCTETPKSANVGIALSDVYDL